MKTCIAFLLFGMGAFAQTFSPSFSTVPITFGKANVFNTSFYTFGVTSGNNNAKPMFVYYNYVTGTNYYSDPNGQIRPTFVPDNAIRGVKIDSFNPNGASDMRTALVTGALNWIFNGNSGKSPFIK
ncbi:MAG: hypothetical protein EOO50_17245 [Flavobacterium sp.]|uniref:hypothetical protein n=1 Tax=Flavobacterium sp. TaxID=239 RepID=UPI00121A3D00|nr:hypothetical protein [Flavobacterium sp.]RZJ63271.1 MAG: hypothetical protein EOO50_17245 [Flavobacterium sp.]